MSTVLIFGGSGSLGSQLVHDLLALQYKVIVVSRSEYKQFVLACKYPDECQAGQLRLVIGDIRGLRAIYANVDYVINCAAMKYIDFCQVNPHEAFNTNVLGNINVINYCLSNHIKRAVYIGTDKSCSPINTYGTTKMIAERDWLNANEKKEQTFSVARFGNLLFSSGSVMGIFLANKSNKYKISSLLSERMFLSLQTASEIVIAGMLGEYKPVFFQPYKKARIVDIVYAMCDNPEFEVVGMREGEKEKEDFPGMEDVGYYTIDEIKQIIKAYKETEA